MQTTDTRPAPITLTKNTVTLYDIESNSVYKRMSHAEAEDDLRLCREYGDTVQEYDTTDRDGTPLRVVLTVCKPLRPGDVDQGGVYEFNR